MIQQQQQQKKQFGEIKKKETDKPLGINGIDSPIFEGLAVCQESKETGQKNIHLYFTFMCQIMIHFRDENRSDKFSLKVLGFQSKFFAFH